MWVNISINSTAAPRSALRKRFYLETALSNVSRVHLTAFELSGGGYTTSQVLNVYFSEYRGGLNFPFFVAPVPIGKYNLQQLCSTLTNAVTCARCINHKSVIPMNKYTVDVCTQTQTIIVRSNGQCLYALHNSHGPYTVVVESVTNTTTFVVSIFSVKSQPLSKGALVHVFSDDVEVVLAQVVDVSAGGLTLCTSIPVTVAPSARLTISPLSSIQSIHDILGFGDTDTTPDVWVPLVGCGLSNPPSDIEGTCLLVGLGVPVGADNEDCVLLQHANGQEYRGSVLSVDATYATVHINTTASLDSLVTSFTKCKVVGPDTIRCPTVVRGVYRVDLSRNRRVAYVRMWLGTTEVPGLIVPTNSGVLSVYGRLQLRQQRDEDVSFAGIGDSSLVGERTFFPPVQKVPYVDVELLDESGIAFTTNSLGEWSLLLRCCAGEHYE